MRDETLSENFMFKLRIATIAIGLLVPTMFQLYGGIDLPFADFIKPFLLWTSWSFLPFLILFAVSFKINKTLLIFLPLLLMTCIEVYVSIEIILTESIEKSSVITLFLPLYQLCIAMPFAMLIGWIVNKIQSKAPPPVRRR